MVVRKRSRVQRGKTHGAWSNTIRDTVLFKNLLENDSKINMFESMVKNRFHTVMVTFLNCFVFRVAR